VNPFDGERKAGSVGLPVPNVRMTIRDLEGQEVSTGEMGEICVAGPNVMKGYWELPEATAETFFGEWLRTGDLGYIDEDGYIFMVDRIKDMIIVNGMNVYPRQIEEVLHQHEAVLEAAVVGQPHASHGEIVVAYVVPVEGHSVTEAKIKQFCKERLGQHQLPRRVEIRDGLPKNASGKILKRELRKEGEVERGIN
jgi:long-chain acyl-CoA synthetase